MCGAVNHIQNAGYSIGLPNFDINTVSELKDIKT